MAWYSLQQIRKYAQITEATRFHLSPTPEKKNCLRDSKKKSVHGPTGATVVFFLPTFYYDVSEKKKK